MKVFFDTNVYVAEVLLGDVADRILRATVKASWRVYSSRFLLAELDRVMVNRLGLSRRHASLTRRRVERRSQLVEPAPSRHRVPADADDSPILRAALAGSVDFLVTNDDHLLSLSAYEGIQIVSMSRYYHLLQEHRLLD
jgi:uncharacterized protein